MIGRSESIASLAEALAKAQGIMRPAPKDSDNPFFRSRYADLATVWGACRDALTTHGLCVLQPVASDAESVTVTTILAHASGEWISTDLWVPLPDPETISEKTGKKIGRTAQQVGSAITYGRRYGLAAMVGVAPDEDDDGHAASHPSQADQAQAPKPAAKPQSAPALVSKALTDEIQDELRRRYPGQDTAAKDARKKLLRLYFGSAWGELFAMPEPKLRAGLDGMRKHDELPAWAGGNAPAAPNSELKP